MLHRYRGLLFSLCRRFSRRGLEVDDLMQEASIALWCDHERLLTMGTGPAQAALVWKIGRNAMIDILRKHRPTEELPDNFDMADDDRSLVDELYAQVDSLDEPDRTIVNMQLSGFNYEEIAARTKLTVKNVSVRLVRAKERLRQEMNRTSMQ